MRTTLLLSLLSIYNACKPALEYVQGLGLPTFSDVWNACDRPGYMAWCVSVFMNGENACAEEGWPGGEDGPDFVDLPDGTPIGINGHGTAPGRCDLIRSHYPAHVIERAIVERVTRDGAGLVAILESLAAPRVFKVGDRVKVLRVPADLAAENNPTDVQRCGVGTVGRVVGLKGYRWEDHDLTIEVVVNEIGSVGDTWHFAADDLEAVTQ